jgi:hypothetical protein
MSSVAALFQMRAGRLPRVFCDKNYLFKGIGLPPIPRPLQLFFLGAGNTTGHGCYFGCGLHRVCALAIIAVR